LSIALLLLAFLAGCGQKGPLVLPDHADEAKAAKTGEAAKQPEPPVH
jgi:predicted small lipoprotein YifL